MKIKNTKEKSIIIKATVLFFIYVIMNIICTNHVFAVENNINSVQKNETKMETYTSKLTRKFGFDNFYI